ncbi:MAG: cation:proton antiporter, partial [Armatimonadetes bacterium]|nr:cation:proton antiporter [Armatimonadota bacterium]
MSETGRIFLDLFLLFASAKLGGALLRKLGQPGVIGEILAGIIIGPHLLGLVSESEFHTVFAEMGVVFLLFIVGLETQPTGLFKVGRQAGTVGFFGMVLPFGLALLLMNALGRPTVEGMFVGAALTATSVGITARVLSDLGYLGTRVARIILGAAVLDDILGMLVLAVVSGLAAGALSAFQIELLAAEAVAFVVLSLLVGRFAIGRLSPRIARRSSGTSRGPLFAIAIALCFALSALADKIGLAAIIGAFFAGIIFAEIP